jgi:tetratricopeptide (TPR) repeat protein
MYSPGVTVNWQPFMEAGFAAENDGRTKDAEHFYKQALKLAEADVGFEHEEVADTLMYLAAVYEAQGRLDEAEKALRRAIFVVERACGASHPALGFFMLNLADICHAQGNTAEAAQLRHRSRQVVHFDLMHGNSRQAA